jgi:hypothetical protein
MNKSKLMILSALALGGLSGCVVPAPHTSQRSPEVRGRVIDATTQLPIGNVTVALHEHPSIMARTDDSGAYRIRATHNIHLARLLGPCTSELPAGQNYGDELDVSHPLYHTKQIRAQEYRDELFTDGTLREIVLVPLSKP